MIGLVAVEREVPRLVLELFAPALERTITTLLHRYHPPMTQLDDRIYALARSLTTSSSIMKILTVLAFAGLWMCGGGHLRHNPVQASLALPFGLVAAAGLIGLAIVDSRSRS